MMLKLRRSGERLGERQGSELQVETGVDEEESVTWGFTIGSIVRAVFAAVLFHVLTGASVRSIWLPQQGDLDFPWRSYLLPRPTRTR